MRSDISALLDNELEPTEASRVMDALRRDKALQGAWSSYHLIGDVLRYSPDCSLNIAERVMARLEAEPVQIAPSAQKNRPPLRFALPLAAAVMGMAAVGWVALSLNTPPTAELASIPRQAKAMEIAATDKAPSGTLKEYLVAHQAHSSGGGIQGVASYVRTVSDIHQGNRR